MSLFDFTLQPFIVASPKGAGISLLNNKMPCNMHPFGYPESSLPCDKPSSINHAYFGLCCLSCRLWDPAGLLALLLGCSHPPLPWACSVEGSTQPAHSGKLQPLSCAHCTPSLLALLLCPQCLAAGTGMCLSLHVVREQAGMG